MLRRIPSYRSRRIYVDSSAYAATLDRDDEHHQQAIAIASRVVEQRYRFVTTNALLIEAHAVVLSILGRVQAREFVRSILESNTTVVRVRPADEARALELLFRYSDKDFSLNDAISFVVMERLGIHLAFTFDSDFAQYGFTVVEPALLQ